MRQLVLVLLLLMPLTNQLKTAQGEIVDNSNTVESTVNNTIQFTNEIFTVNYTVRCDIGLEVQDSLIRTIEESAEQTHETSEHQRSTSLHLNKLQAKLGLLSIGGSFEHTNLTYGINESDTVKSNHSTKIKSVKNTQRIKSKDIFWEIAILVQNISRNKTLILKDVGIKFNINGVPHEARVPRGKNYRIFPSRNERVLIKIPVETRDQMRIIQNGCKHNFNQIKFDPLKDFLGTIYTEDDRKTDLISKVIINNQNAIKLKWKLYSQYNALPREVYYKLKGISNTSLEQILTRYKIMTGAEPKSLRTDGVWFNIYKQKLSVINQTEPLKNQDHDLTFITFEEINKVIMECYKHKNKGCVPQELIEPLQESSFKDTYYKYIALLGQQDKIIENRDYINQLQEKEWLEIYLLLAGLDPKKVTKLTQRTETYFQYVNKLNSSIWKAYLSDKSSLIKIETEINEFRKLLELAWKLNPDFVQKNLGSYLDTLLCVNKLLDRKSLIKTENSQTITRLKLLAAGISPSIIESLISDNPRSFESKLINAYLIDLKKDKANRQFPLQVLKDHFDSSLVLSNPSISSFDNLIRYVRAKSRSTYVSAKSDYVSLGMVEKDEPIFLYIRNTWKVGSGYTWVGPEGYNKSSYRIWTKAFNPISYQTEESMLGQLICYIKKDGENTYINMIKQRLTYFVPYVSGEFLCIINDHDRDNNSGELLITLKSSHQNKKMTSSNTQRLLNDWKGVRFSSASGKNWTIELNARRDSKQLSVEYPTYGCKGEWHLLTRSEDNLTFTYKEVLSKGSCTNNLFVSVKLENDHLIDARYYRTLEESKQHGEDWVDQAYLRNFQ